MRELGLTIRMVIASTVLMGVYAIMGLVLFGMGGVWAAVLGLPFLIAAQYFVTVYLPLMTEESREITPKNFPELHEQAERLAKEFDIAKPTIYLSENDNMNARAHGRRGNGKVFLNRGLVQRMSLDELEPILAHEFAHLKNRDSILMNLGTSIVSIFSSVLFLLFLIASLDSEHPWLVRLVGAIVSVCVHFILLFFVGVMSRYREYVADEAAVRATGQYDGMRNALDKLRSEKQRINESNMSARRGAISFVDFSGGVAGQLLATHPPLDKRISRIEDLKAEVRASEETTRSTEVEDNHPSNGVSWGNSLEELPDQQLINGLQVMDEYAFEQLIGDLWSKIGWRTRVTTESMDRGVDVIAERDSPFHEKQIIQAKRYGPDNPVSSSEIQQYASLHIQEDNVDAVVVITTSQFTSNAQEVAADSNVKLVDGAGLCEMIRAEGQGALLEKYLDQEILSANKIGDE